MLKLQYLRPEDHYANRIAYVCIVCLFLALSFFPALQLCAAATCVCICDKVCHELALMALPACLWLYLCLCLCACVLSIVFAFAYKLHCRWRSANNSNSNNNNVAQDSHNYITECCKLPFYSFASTLLFTYCLYFHALLYLINILIINRLKLPVPLLWLRHS